MLTFWPPFWAAFFKRIKTFKTNTENKEEWLTPPYILEALGGFDLDPCAPEFRPWDMAKVHYCKEQDGLSQKWFGRVWCNPPYGRQTFDWLKRLAEHKNGIALIFARTETKGFHSEVWRKAHSVFFFLGRLKFHYPDGAQGDCANAPSCLVAYNADNTDAIKKSGLNGKLIIL